MSGRDVPLCWLCQERPASTREHRVLKARLDLMHGAAGIAVTHPRHRPTLVKGTKSAAVKFGKTMCGTCNGHVSQPWDKAYLQFVKAGLSDPNLYRNKRQITWDNIIPLASESLADLSRYYAKNIGCQLVERGLIVPTELRSYLNSQTQKPPFSLFLVQEYAWLDEIVNSPRLRERPR
ncbi:hypothetical protein [Corynebacterium pseudotuberculosis]|uniref:hypothetical protein n=1 Tax=Corynebacterium pseudotuberculosis TaxID=1719 RepID=UPI000AD249B9|nr:hypothetical protein [Corynebacterium pseudotuberculosis]